MPKLNLLFYPNGGAARFRPGLPLFRAGLAAFVVAGGTFVQGALPVETLRPVLALPPHVAGQFREPAGFAAVKGGGYLVFDRRGHSVYRVPPDRDTASQIVSVGQEQGRVLQPVAFAVAPDSTFVVADAPVGRERVQIFTVEGTRFRGWVLPGHVLPLVQLGGAVLSGVGSLQYDGDHVYVNEPENGGLITSYSIDGTPERTIGRLRQTGFEASDPDLHRIFNTGLPLVNPKGGFYFVFQTGEPRFRKYDAQGTLIYERAIQGVELDRTVASQPTRWPRRDVGGRELPVVPPIVRTAAVDPDGGLWIALTLPYTYVYDAEGDKRRVVQFEAAGTLAPTSLTFASDGRLLVTPGCYVFDGRITTRNAL